MKKVSEINRHSIWSAVISAGSSIASGLLASSAAGSAGKYTKKAAKIAANLQREMYYKSREDLAPMREAGYDAINALRQKLGLGTTGELAIPEFTESPGYRFTLEEGQRAIQNTLSAMGKNRSGKHLRAATAHAEGLASTEYDNFLNRWYRSLNPYFSMAGMGQQAVNTGANLGANTANQMAQAAMMGGQAQAGAAINRANALTGAITGGANALLYYNAMRNLQQQPAATSAGYTPGTTAPTTISTARWGPRYT